MKILQTVGSAAFNLLVILLIFLAYGSVNNRWYRVVTVEGNSMAPTFHIGDLMIITPPRPTVEVNSIVVMRVDGSLVTHRVVGFDVNNRPITKGDANEDVDNFENPDLRIVGIYRFHLPGLGYPLFFLSRLLRST